MKSVLFAVLVLAGSIQSSGAAETAKEKCLKAAMADLAKCQQALPTNVQPKDPQNPTDAEKEAMTKYTKASNACNTKAKDDALACEKK